MLIVIASYRQNVHAYPSGGGDYEVVTTNLGPTAGLTVASALLVDYVLTVAVSMASAMSNIGSAVPFVGQHKVLFAVVAILLLASVNLRGYPGIGYRVRHPHLCVHDRHVRHAGLGAVPDLRVGPSAASGIRRFRDARRTWRGAGFRAGVPGGPGVLLGFGRADRCRGDQQRRAGIPKPKSRNAATTLLLLGFISVTLFMGIILLAKATGAQMAERPHEQLIGAPPDYNQKTLIAQLADAVFHNFPVGLYLIAGVTALILVLAANTAFNGFPVLGSILAQDRFLPRQLHTRGDRLAFSNGILFLAFAAIAFVVAFRAEVTALIQLYIVGVFVSFTFSQIGMVRHWTRLLRTETEPAVRRHMLMRSRVINAIGLTATGTVLVIVVVTKFLAGRLDRDPGDERTVRRHEAHPQALRHGGPRARGPERKRRRRHRAAQPQPRGGARVETAPADQAGTGICAGHPPGCAGGHHRQRRRRRDPCTGAPVGRQRYQCAAEGDRFPYREITRPVLDYVKRVTKESPRTVVTVFIPEYVVGHWWEQVLHNQSALRLKGRLLFIPNVMVTSVPWQLNSSERLRALQPRVTPGDARRGFLE